MSDITRDDLRKMVDIDYRGNSPRQKAVEVTDEEFDRLAREWLREKITAYHPDGTDYINDGLERAVIEAVGRYAFLPERTLAGIAAIRAVLDWLGAEHE